MGIACVHATRICAVAGPPEPQVVFESMKVYRSCFVCLLIGCCARGCVGCGAVAGGLATVVVFDGCVGTPIGGLRVPLSQLNRFAMSRTLVPLDRMTKEFPWLHASIEDDTPAALSSQQPAPLKRPPERRDRCDALLFFSLDRHGLHSHRLRLHVCKR
jgi:hypothetical protein